MSSPFQWLLDAIIRVVNFFTALLRLSFLQQPWFLPISLVSLIVSFFTETIRNPTGAINQIGIHFVDIVDGVLPSTPPEYQLATLISGLTSQVPGFAQSIISEIMSGVVGILSIFLLIKAYKLLPFV